MLSVKKFIFSNYILGISGTKLSISKSEKCFGVSSVIFKTDQTVLSCCSMDQLVLFIIF